MTPIFYLEQQSGHSRWLTTATEGRWQVFARVRSGGRGRWHTACGGWTRWNGFLQPLNGRRAHTHGDWSLAFAEEIWNMKRGRGLLVQSSRPFKSVNYKERLVLCLCKQHDTYAIQKCWNVCTLQQQKSRE